MPLTRAPVANIGSAAREVLLHNQEAVVSGVVGRGVFLSFSDEWVIFLSAENKRGPLTLNVYLNPATEANLQPGDRVEISPEGLSFPDAALLIDLAGAVVWEAPEPAPVWLPARQVKARLEALVAELLGDAKPGGMIGLLPEFFGLPECAARGDREAHLAALFRKAEQMIAARPDHFSEQLVASLSPFLGLGKGLTPSGDDFILGFLLSLNRWGGRLRPGLELESLNQEMSEQARLRTTALSASLIRCAAAGQADERLVFALDGCLSGDWDLTASAAALKGWGSSSGMDAFAGMTLGLSAIL